jgi:DNA polymerase
LPSGRELRYPKLHQRGREWNYWDGYAWQKIYGGKLAENIVQAAARDVVCAQLLDIDKLVLPLGGDLVFMSHDEAISVVPESEANYVLQEKLRIMKTPLSWCPDLPLSAEGAIGDTYADCK